MSDPSRDTSVARYVAVAQVLAREAKGMALSEALAEVSKIPIRVVDGRMLRFSERTLRRWVAAFKQHGLDGLWPKSRSPFFSKSLSPDFLRFLEDEKKQDPFASIPEIVRRAQVDGIVIRPVPRVSVWRAARRMNLPIFSDKGPKNSDKRRFSYAHRMQMILTDGKHFRAGATRKRRVVMTFLDDSTRFALACVVGTSEYKELFARGLWRVLSRWGLFSAIFVDNGSAFKSNDGTVICARLGVALIHGTSDYPEGRGKIERFHRTLAQDLLRTFDGNPEIDPAESALELRIDHYLDNLYNRHPHEGLDGQTPEERFLADTLALRLESDPAALRRHFVIKQSRKVSRDNVVSVDSVPYEMPKGHAGRRIDTFRHVLDGTVSVIVDGRNLTLSPVNVTLNALSKRARRLEQEEEAPRPPKSAATRAFLRDYPPVVSPAGDFHDKE